MRARIATLMSILMAVGLLLSACATPAATPTAPPEAITPPEPTATTPPEPEDTPTLEVPKIKRGGVLKVGVEADFVMLDPAHNEAAIDSTPIDLVYESLVRWDPETLEPLPLLAKSWEISNDGLTYTFYLEEGVKWHNGDDFVAEDVKYSVERIQDPEEGSVRASYLSSIESVEVVDDYTVVFNLSEPYAPLLNYLPFTPKIQHQGFVEAEGGTTPRTMMGTGPFMFEEWIPDQVLRLEQNPDYWRLAEDGEALPYLDGIEFYPTADETARLDTFLAGVTDFMVLVPDKDVDTLEQNPDVVLAGPETLWFSSIWMHCQTPPWDDVRVRQAVSWAMDRDEIADVGLFGRVSPMYGGIMPDWHWAGNQLVVYDHRDVEKARELLEEAGYPDGFEATIAVGEPYPSEVTLAEMTASYLQDVGIDASVEIMEWGTFISDLIGGNLPIFSVGLALNGDPDEAYYQPFHSEGGFNVIGYSNSEVDRLLEEARQVSDPAERKDLYRQIEEILLEDVPHAFAIQHQEWEAYYPYVKDYVHMPNSRRETLMYVWLDQ